MMSKSNQDKKTQLWFYCKCGFMTPIETGMMCHLSFYKGKIHRYFEALNK